MNQCNKRKSNNKEVMIQRWSVITLQEMQDFNKNNEEKKDKRNTKEID